MNWNLLFQLVVNGMIVGALYGVVAMCFVLIYKASQVVNFAQGEFLLIGAWVCWWLLTTCRFPFCLGFLFTLAFMMAFGVILQIVVLRPLIGEPVISVIMVDDRAVDLLPGADEVDVRRLRQALPADLRDAVGQRPRASGADRLPDEPGHLAAHHGRLRLVLQILQAWAGDAGDRLRPAGGAVARHLRAATSSRCPGRSRPWCRRWPAWWSAWSTACPRRSPSSASRCSRR